MLTRLELLGLVHTYAGEPAADATSNFEIVHVMHMANGIIATEDQDGEFALFFDRAHYQITHPAFQGAEDSPRLPSELGILVDVTSKSFEDIRLVSMSAIGKVDSEDKILWFPMPIPVTYPPE